MTTVILGGKKKGTKNLTGGGLMDMAKNAVITAVDATKAAAGAGIDVVKGTAAETTQSGGRRRRRRSSRRRSSARSSKLRKRTGKVRRHATRSYRKTKKTKRA
jgi:hypothetical protein